MNYYLIDFENVTSNDLMRVKDIKKNSTVILFYTKAKTQLNLDFIHMLHKNKVQLRTQKVINGTKNALDFQLSTFLGWTLKDCDAADNFFIVAKDKGYDCVVNYWHTRNKKIYRIAPPASSSQASPKQKKIAVKKTNLKHQL